MNINPRQVLGGIIGGFEESSFEMESFLSSVTAEPEQNGKLAIGGKTELNGFNKREAELERQLKQKEEADRKRRFYQSLKEDYDRSQRAKDKLLFEEELDDTVTNMSTDEKNRLLHYQASYKDRSIYQIAALRKKIIEEKRKAEKQQKAAAIPSPAKQASALETAFEGASGKQGSGTANLSAHATG